MLVAKTSVFSLTDPTNLTDFNTTSSGDSYPLLMPNFMTLFKGSYWANVNVSYLGVSGVTNGTLATIVMINNSGHEPLYQVCMTCFSHSRGTVLGRPIVIYTIFY